MQISQAEENKNRIISGAITAGIFALLLLLLIFFNLVTPNPPFPESADGGGQELALGMVNMGNDNIDYGSMGAVSDVVTEKQAAQEELMTDENGEEIAVPPKEEKKKPDVKEKPVEVKPEQPKVVIKEKTDAEKLAEKFKKNSGKNGGGVGDNTQAGENGDPNGDPSKNGTGGEGTGTGGSKGPGGSDGPPGKGTFGNGKISAVLAGRSLVVPPKLPTDTKEEGKVVVVITVNNKGVVIDANPNGRGTTTSSVVLKMKAKQAALATTFNVDDKFEEQKGTITIIFSY